MNETTSIKFSNMICNSLTFPCVTQMFRHIAMFLHFLIVIFLQTTGLDKRFTTFKISKFLRNKTNKKLYTTTLLSPLRFTFNVRTRHMTKR
jgi:hypothetical protein